MITCVNYIYYIYISVQKYGRSIDGKNVKQNNACWLLKCQ